MAAQGSNLVQRGMLMLAFVATIAVVVVLVTRRAPLPATNEPISPEPLLTRLAVPAAPFPGSVQWGALAQLGDALPSSPGWSVRYNAAYSLARLGSPELPLDLVAEMLDERQQTRNYRVKQERSEEHTSELQS